MGGGGQQEEQEVRKQTDCLLFWCAAAKKTTTPSPAPALYRSSYRLDQVTSEKPMAQKATLVACCRARLLQAPDGSMARKAWKRIWTTIVEDLRRGLRGVQGGRSDQRL